MTRTVTIAGTDYTVKIERGKRGHWYWISYQGTPFANVWRTNLDKHGLRWRAGSGAYRSLDQALAMELAWYLHYRERGA